MRNKMVLILGAFIVLFGALYFVTSYKNNQAVNEGNNPYGKDRLQQETIDQLDDPLYQNQITPEKLNERLDAEESVTVYFYSPTCSHCQKATPVLVPVAEDLDIDLKKVNLLEFDDQWQTYGIEGVPAVVHYENGVEVDRISGEQPEEVFKDFFNKNVLN